MENLFSYSVPKLGEDVSLGEVGEGMQGWCTDALESFGRQLHFNPTQHVW